MCGICGIFDRSGEPASRPLLERMTASMRHRGPDGDGTILDGEAGLGHRRLAIIDLDGGAQPIDNESGRLHVVFNGEIYNFSELRQELSAFGHRFKTRSDTEVIVHAYEQWGKDCVQRFNGMFALALWDADAREIFLARDHLGVKPLYYVTLGSRVLFASEIKSLLQDPDCPKDVDEQALAELFTFRYVPSPRTLFKGIRKLPPAHRMVISAQGVTLDRFWSHVPSARAHYSEPELIEAVPSSARKRCPSPTEKRRAIGSLPQFRRRLRCASGNYERAHHCAGPGVHHRFRGWRGDE